MSDNRMHLPEEMKPFIKTAWDKAGFDRVTDIQREAVPPVMAGKDVLATAPTGSGKTLAYLLPILNKIDSEQKNTQAVILASSRELVMQIHEQLQTFGEGSGISSTTLIGGANIKRQLEKMKKHPRIVIGTPGRVYELIQKKKLKMHEVKTVVMDEGDQLLLPEHKATVENIIKSTLADRQLLLFSATLPEKSKAEALEMMNTPVVIKLDKEQGKPDVAHVYLTAESRKKTDILKKLSGIPEFRGLVFVKDIGTLNVAAEKLAYMGVDAAVIHGDSRKDEREKALKAFKKEEVPLLLATDVAARGIDIKDLPFVVNYDIPKEVNSYVHRAGRTGRFGAASGTVVSIVNEQEEKRLRKFAKELAIEPVEKVLYKGRLNDVKTGRR
ncbi:DEAD/DEAH box helicase [Thalassobacillus pellis]|uniref:DEAD/DEAH box helicase n=1 Tax=Thalassobacillus pellis TaxID=748008 RepID=UPI0019611BB3|nr:DEAD/DEAH box helicase [Thalassobacillus pellis]MBM7553110.1 superfamily II DNA/RNA helicase [Thalassobacillus pellis]